jgi:DNA repair protein RadA/Sms
VNGADPQRVAVLLAVLSKRAGLSLGTHDVYVNLVGGLRVREPAADLALAVSIASALRDKAADPAVVPQASTGELDGTGMEVVGVATLREALTRSGISEG